MLKKKNIRNFIKKGFVSAFVLFYTFAPSIQAIDSLFSLKGNEVEAASYTLASSSGVWTNVTQKQGANTNGTDTSKIKWGGSNGSSLEFVGVTNKTIEENKEFDLGILTHTNMPINAAATGADLELSINLGSLGIKKFTFKMEIEETSNTEGQCPYYPKEVCTESYWNWDRTCVAATLGTSTTPCDDKITLTNPSEPITFEINDIQYTLKITGFRDKNNNNLDAFYTEEGKATTATLKGILTTSLIEKPGISIKKLTNNIDVASEANAPELYVGSDVTWKYVVQNIGNVELTNVTVTDDKLASTSITCPSTILAAGAKMDCTASGTATAGTYHNTATVVGTHSSGTVTDSDESWYKGINYSSLTVQKTTIGETGTTETETVFDITLSDGTTTGTVTNSKDYTFSNLVAGTYSVTETAKDGWKETSNTCENVALTEGQNAKCTITNTKLPTLTINKVTNPTNITSGFNLLINGETKASNIGNNGTTGAVIATIGENTFGETAVSGDLSDYYTVITGDGCSQDGKITLAAGENKTCTITNNKLASLTIVKEATPESSTVFNFSTRGTGLSNFTVIDDGTTANTKTFTKLNPGTYTVTEENTVSTNGLNWDNKNITCTGNTNSTTDLSTRTATVILAYGEDVTCTYSNTQRGSISGYKLKDADGLSTTETDRAPVSGWTIQLVQNGTVIKTTTTDNNGYYSFENLEPGTYTVQEVMQTNWTNLIATSQAVTLNPGKIYATANFINYKLGSITILKNIDGNGDGDLLDSVDKVGTTDWSWNLSGTSYTETTNNTGTKVSTLYPGTYTVQEIQQDNYHIVSFECNDGNKYSANEIQNITLASDQDLVCTYTNARNLGTLIVKKVVVNDNGGAKTAKDFSFNIDNGDSISFEEDGENQYTKYAGLKYTITEVEDSGYATTYSNSLNNNADCNKLTVPYNGTVTCTITNNDIPATLTVIKEVENDEDGTAVASGFSINITGVTNSTDSTIQGSTSGTTVSMNAGEYSVTESLTEAQKEYYNETPTYTGDCNGTIENGKDYKCTITNKDKNITPSISVTKVADKESVKETGEDVKFTFTITNTSTANDPITLTSINDSVYGDLEGVDDCKIGTKLEKGTSCTFFITKFVEGDYSGNAHSNTVTVKGVDDEQTEAVATATETVSFTDVLPTVEVTKTANPTSVLETGGNVTYTYTVKNTSGENVAISSLEDDIFGTLSGNSDCSKFTQLEPDQSCSFELVKSISGVVGTPHINKFTATVIDNEDKKATDTATATVTFTDVLPVIDVTKSVSDSSVPETGKEVTYTYTVTNTGTVSVTIDSLADDKIENFVGDEDCNVGTLLAPSASCTFEVKTPVSGVANSTLTNTFTAVAKDHENNEATDSATATVTFTDVLPVIDVTKSVDDTSVPETGQEVTYTYTIINSGTVDVTISSLTDDKLGTLSGDNDCKVGTSLAPSASCTFEVKKTVSGVAKTTLTNTFTAVAKDHENNEATDEATATVTFEDIKPSISVVKTVNNPSVPETGQEVTYTYTITNNGEVSVKLTSFYDDKISGIAGDNDCYVGKDLVAGGSCEFTATKLVSGGKGTTHVNNFTVKAEDNEKNEAKATDDATVTFYDVLPQLNVEKTVSKTTLKEEGEKVTYTYKISNPGTVETEITAISDDKIAGLDGGEGCTIGTKLGAGKSCTFTADKLVSGNAGSEITNTLSVTVKDIDGNNLTDTDTATVTFVNQDPAIEVTKESDKTSVDETGEDVTFTFTVKNTSLSKDDPITITSISDSVYGELEGDEDCKVGTTLPKGETCTFSITKFVSGDYSGNDHYNEFTVTAKDDEGTSVSDKDDITIDFKNIEPTLTVEKTAGVSAIKETGEAVTYTFTVTNTSKEDVTITSLLDDKFAPNGLAGSDTCKVNTVLGTTTETNSCTFTATFDVPAGTTDDKFVNTFTATVTDNDNTSKTASDNATVTYTDVAPEVSITKTADKNEVKESGEDVIFTFTIENKGTVNFNITSLTDTVFGDLNGKGTCAIGGTLLPTETYSCTYTKKLSSDTLTAHKNTVTVEVTDDDGTTDDASDDETVTFTDEKPVISVEKTASPESIPETGGKVEYTFTVTNESAENVKITSLVDNKFAITGDDDCKVGTVLGTTDNTNSCTFTATFDVPAGKTGTDYVNTFTAKAVDNDTPEEVSATDTATVTYTDVAPEVSITKTADKNEVKESGEDIIFTFTIENKGTVNFNITSLTDTVFGDLNGKGTCVTGGTLAPKGTYSCTYTKRLSSDSLIAHENTVTVEVTDDDGTTDDASDDETVTFVDEKPVIKVTKTAITESVPETGGKATYKFVVTNESTEAVKITSLHDETLNVDLSGDTDCKIGEWIAVGESCEFTQELTIPAGEAPNTFANTFTAKAVDNDTSNEVSDSDDAEIPYTNVATLTLKKVVENGYGTDNTASEWTLTATNSSNVEVVSVKGNNEAYTYVGEGVYTLAEDGPDGFEASAWLCTAGRISGNTITLTNNDDAVCTITNTALPGTIIVNKNVVDIEDNGEIYEDNEYMVDNSEDILADGIFDINLSGEDYNESGKISDNGEDSLSETFDKLSSGTYTFTESTTDGYNFKGCYVNGKQIDSLNVANGKTINVTCYNDVIEPELLIKKSNDSIVTGMYAGENVTYTITVTAPERLVEVDLEKPINIVSQLLQPENKAYADNNTKYIVNGVTVTDIAPAGFNYITGTWTATSSTRGDIKKLGVTTEPTYSGNLLATWNLGTMTEGETVTLTYTTNISNTQDTGLYNDIALTNGVSISGSQVLGNQNIGVYVDTNVLVIEDQEIEEGEVLGVATIKTLPDTGASIFTTILGALSAIGGLFLLLLGGRKKRTSLIMGIAMIGMFLVPTTANAAESTTLKVTLEQPTTPTAENTFNIGYVALDYVDNNVTVSCYETTAGLIDTYTGNAGNCVVDKSVITTSGTYEFYAIAETTTGTKESNHVTVITDLVGPSQVTNYTKTKNTDTCTYTLTFTTANDGETTGVQIFRAETTNFTLNASTLENILSVSPNQTVTYTDTTITDCNKEYYYAVRAVDSLNNTSTIVSDDLVTIQYVPTTTTNTTNTTGTTNNNTSTTVVVTTNPDNTTIEDTTAEVEGVTDTTEDTENTTTGEQDKETGEVEGTQTTDTKESFFSKYKFVIIALVAIVAGSIIYMYATRKNKQS